MANPTFGTREIYDQLAAALNEDPKWLDKASILNYTMSHWYAEPMGRAFGMRFDHGKLLDVTEGTAKIPADFILSATPEVWERILVSQTLNPQVAIVTRKLVVDGKMSALLKHIGVFNYLLNVLTGLEPVMPDGEA